MKGWVGQGTTTVSEQSAQDSYVAAIAVVSCSSCHAWQSNPIGWLKHRHLCRLDQHVYVLSNSPDVLVDLSFHVTTNRIIWFISFKQFRISYSYGSGTGNQVKSYNSDSERNHVLAYVMPSVLTLTASVNSENYFLKPKSGALCIKDITSKLILLRTSSYIMKTKLTGRESGHQTISQTFRTFHACFHLAITWPNHCSLSTWLTGRLHAVCISHLGKALS